VVTVVVSNAVVSGVASVVDVDWCVISATKCIKHSPQHAIQQFWTLNWRWTVQSLLWTRENLVCAIVHCGNSRKSTTIVQYTHGKMI